MSHITPNEGSVSLAGTLPKAAIQSRPSRPNYNVLHALPLPLSIHPLPPLIPHNPLSVIYFAYTYLYQLIVPLSSHRKTKLKASFSSETQSVHVTDQNAARVLWECGFFGKGNLSRSEPSWLDRERRRRGIVVGETSEEVTRRRREERREFKKKRARKERETIETALKEEKLSTSDDLLVQLTDASKFLGDPSPALRTSKDTDDLLTSNGTLLDSCDPAHIVSSVTEDSRMPFLDSGEYHAEVDAEQDMLIGNQEHLQLTFEEAFFLTYGLGIIEVENTENTEPLTTNTLLTLFRVHSHFPSCTPSDLRPDDPFLISYVVYHHFRSLGWVVRSGIKFAVDYLLYNRGPVFSHAEFAVIVLPSYHHPCWRETTGQDIDIKKRESKSWWWLHCVNRVQSQVKKSLVLAYVEIPPPRTTVVEDCLDDHSETDISQMLKSYRVREMIVRRWIPNRSRD
ncbi:tRNA-splicing endonuclease subunit Sen2 [Xylographa vitiligo]|nr:tRNA-splicing endonuclease subunit Sen2 [Xylographa vitiligo]